MRRFLLGLVLLGGVAASAAAQAPIPVECSAEVVRSWQPFIQELRAAKPDARIYAPKPFPVAVADVIADFVYGYVRVLWKGTQPSDIPSNERPLYEGVVRSELSYQVVRVENWSNTRCLRDQPRRFSYLLTIFSKSDGREVARVALDESGLVAEWLITPFDEKGRSQMKAYLPLGLKEAASLVGERFGIKASQLQYVQTWGDLRCAAVMPCVALQKGETVYILRAGELFEVGPRSRRLTQAQMDRRDLLAKAQSSLSSETERLVSIGAAPWAVARRVPPMPGEGPSKPRPR